MGMLRDFSVAENLVLQRVGEPPFTRRGWLDREAITRNAQERVAAYDVRTPSVETLAGNLSGGNAQKMVLARELARDPKVLLAAQPTRGLDVTAIEFVHRKLIEQRDAGLAVLLISTELDEILALSDRIAVMYEGRIVGVMPAAGVDVNAIGLMMAGARGQGEGVAQVTPTTTETQALAHSRRLPKWVVTWARRWLGVVVGLGIGALLILIAGANPFAAYAVMFTARSAARARSRRRCSRLRLCC